MFLIISQSIQIDDWLVCMGYNFRDYTPGQIQLLPPSLDDWLPQQHLARFIHHIVDSLDLSPLMRMYRDDGHGRSAYHPAMMLKVLLYAYCVGVPSSRKIAQKLVDDVAFRWLATGNLPDFRSIATFRRRHLDTLKDLFVQVLLHCKQAGLVQAGVVALDGTKIKANAALDRNRTWEKLEAQETELRQRIEQLLAGAETTDADEDRRFGDTVGDGLPEVKTATDMLGRVRRAKAELEAQARARAEEQQAKLDERKHEEAESGRKKRGRKPAKADPTVEPEAKANITDPDSRIQKTRQGYVQGYNAQVVASSDQIIVACDVVKDQNDVAQLLPMIEVSEANLYEIGEEPGTVLADAGYCSEENLSTVAEPGWPEVLVATKKDHKQRNQKDPAPRGPIPNGLNSRDRMTRKLKTKAAKALYKMRGQIVEAVFGQVKDCRKLAQFLLRGLPKVQGEFRLMCLTHNLLKMWRASAVPA